MRLVLITAMLASAVPAFAQKDFLTSDEVEKVREAQDPNERLKVYALLARQRLDQLQRLLEKDKRGRSLTARELLEDYSKIIDAMDTVSDDALKRGVDISMGAAAMNDAEKRFLSQLEKIRDRAPADLDLYNVALKEALATTSDSMDLAKEDTGNRAAKLAAEDKKTKEEAEQTIAAEDALGKPVDEAKADPTKTEDGKPKRKPPTLLRKGEQAGQPIDVPRK
jgi:hypothetical protein